VSGDVKLSEADGTALAILLASGGSLLVSAIPDKAERDVIGALLPGMATYRKLERLGFVVLTEEPEFELFDGETFRFTETAELTENGREFLRIGRSPPP
jgi:hypothetical protein